MRPEPDLLHRAAANIAGWHESNARALGLATRRDDWLWTLEAPGPFIYHSAITLQPDGQTETLERLEALRQRRGPGPMGVGDSWAQLDLTAQGFSVYDRPPWYVREPGDSGIRPLDGLTIRTAETVDDLLLFEEASIDGFESPTLRRFGRGGVHARGILDDPAMHVYLGIIDDVVVSVAMAYVAAGLVGIYSISTLPEYRQRGYGEALTRTAITAAPDLPAVLQPSETGAAMYRSIGFRQFGEAITWVHEVIPPTP